MGLPIGSSLHVEVILTKKSLGTVLLSQKSGVDRGGVGGSVGGGGDGVDGAGGGGDSVP